MDAKEDVRKELTVCHYCDGAGWVQDHHPSCSHENGCTGHCPVQDPCVACDSTGLVWRKDVPDTVDESETDEYKLPF